jgi:hypothetical protein
MGVREHAPVHALIGLGAVLVAEQFAKAVGHGDGLDPFPQKLTDGEGLSHPFDELPLILCKLVSAHAGITALSMNPLNREYLVSAFDFKVFWRVHHNRRLAGER